MIDLEVPRAREGGSAGAGVFGRYKRRTQEIDDTIVSAYVHGASTRDIGQITETLMGEHVGRWTVSRVTKSLNEKVEELRNAPITGPIPYLFLDATFLDARLARKVENVSALVAHGIGLDGKRQLLAVTIGAEESEDSWSELLGRLNERGLSGVQLVVADAHAGIAKAVRHHLPANSMNSTYTYDDFRRLLKVGSPEARGGATFLYDARGNVLRKKTIYTTVSYTYDGLDRLVTLSATDGYTGSSVAYTYSYDATPYPGRLTSIVEPDRTISYGYDAAGRLTSESQSLR